MDLYEEVSTRSRQNNFRTQHRYIATTIFKSQRIIVVNVVI